MEAYIVPDWITVIAGLIIHTPRPNPKVLLGLRSARQETDKWCLPAGLGAIRTDITAELATNASVSLANPEVVVRRMSKRHQQAFKSPGGFALAEAKWDVEIPPDVGIEELTPLKPICQLDNEGLLVKIYFGLECFSAEPWESAKTSEWPFKEIRFFSKEELERVSVAFGCDRDLEEIFWKL